MKITNNFTLEELNPHNFKLSLKQTINLEHLAYYTLQPLRDYINTPIKITSGFRSVKYNDSIGGVKNSQHTQWWGTGTTKDDPNNKYAGFPQTAQTIVSYTQYNQNATITDIAYKLDIPTTQQAGIYDGTVTYQAIVNP